MSPRSPAATPRAKPTTVVDENGIATNLAYDARNRLTTITVNPAPPTRLLRRNTIRQARSWPCDPPTAEPGNR